MSANGTLPKHAPQNNRHKAVVRIAKNTLYPPATVLTMCVTHQA
jgi:hypothetical protein